MKKITLLFIFCLTMATWSYGQCTSFSGGGPFVDFNTDFVGAPCDDGSGCPFNEITNFEIWADESYLMDNVVTGHTYTFSTCNGPGAGSWPISFTIIAPSGAIDAFGSDAGSTCAITWTATEDGTYEIGISEDGVLCDSSTNQSVDNGFPAITCSGASTCVACMETAAPACTTPIAPTDGNMSVATVTSTTDGSREVAFEWAAVTGADEYEVTLDGTALGNTPNTTVNIYGLDYDTDYTWSIAPINCFGTATGCSTWSFRTEVDPALNVDNFENSTKFSIFPNPVKDVLTVKTGLTIDTIEVYNILGKRVSVFNNNIVDNSINIKDLDSGIYFLNISAEGKTESIKIVKE